MNYFILWTVFEFLCSAVAFAFLIYYVISGKYNSQAKSNRQIENYVVTTSESSNYYYDLDKGESGELEVRNIIQKIDGHKKILSNLYIPTPDGRTTEIDVLMIHESGIYLLGTPSSSVFRRISFNPLSPVLHVDVDNKSYSYSEDVYPEKIKVEGRIIGVFERI